MKKKDEKQNVRLSISLKRGVYDMLVENAKNDYLKVATWTKRFIMQNLDYKNNEREKKCLTKNGNAMQ